MRKLTEQMIQEVNQEIDENNEDFCAAAELIKAGILIQKTRNRTIQIVSVGNNTAKEQLGTDVFYSLVNILQRQSGLDLNEKAFYEAGNIILKMLEKHVPWLKKYLRDEVRPALAGYRGSAYTDAAMSLHEIGRNIAEAVLRSADVDVTMTDPYAAMRKIEIELTGRKQMVKS